MLDIAGDVGHLGLWEFVYGIQRYCGAVDEHMMGWIG
jgi:hypothetical protein